MVRLKTRYLLFEVLYPENLQLNNVSESLRRSRTKLDHRKLSGLLRQSLLDNFGEAGLGQVQTSLLLKYFSPATLTGIVRVTRDHWKIVQAALSYITSIDNAPVIIKVFRVSGTIKKGQQAAIARDKDFVDIFEKDPP